MQLVSPSLNSLIARNDTAAMACKSLIDGYDRKNITSTFHTLNACLSLTKNNDTTMHAHLTNFDEHFNRLASKVDSATDGSCAYFRGLKMFLSDTEAKAHLLLLTLPAAIAIVIDNLS